MIWKTEQDNRRKTTKSKPVISDAISYPPLLPAVAFFYESREGGRHKDANMLIWQANIHVSKAPQIRLRSEGTNMTRIRFVSFDLDGTLFDNKFVDSVWLEEIPRLYSLKKRISIDDAIERVQREYDKVGKERLEWYDLQYWIEKFGLDVARDEILRKFEDRIKVFPEVPRELERLKRKGFRLIVVTNARREFAELELQKCDMEKHFERVFSSTSDFGMVKKTTNLYRKVCKILDVSTQEIIHVGDDLDFDFKVPRKLGILAFHLDRTGKQKGEYVICSINELNRRLTRLEA